MGYDPDAIAKDLVVAYLQNGEFMRTPSPSEDGTTSGAWIGDFYAEVLRKVSAAQAERVEADIKRRDR
jgi:hypothetical protein